VITISAVLDPSGLLKSCDVRGHAGAGKRGNDLVCAAVSVLTRTALSTLSEAAGLSVKAQAPERGVFKLEAGAENAEGRIFLKAAGAFLLGGLQSVAREYPENCTIEIITERRN
jgi:uncharacterized protein YsxB (DUF464 family)